MSEALGNLGGGSGSGGIDIGSVLGQFGGSLGGIAGGSDFDFSQLGSLASQFGVTGGAGYNFKGRCALGS